MVEGEQKEQRRERETEQVDSPRLFIGMIWFDPAAGGCRDSSDAADGQAGRRGSEGGEPQIKKNLFALKMS